MLIEYVDAANNTVLNDCRGVIAQQTTSITAGNLLCKKFMIIALVFKKCASVYAIT